MGTVVQLKHGIEEAFSHLPKRGPGMVSWSHMWGHFCLSYDGQRLLIDDDCIGHYKIRDGDTLCFVQRFMVVACNVAVKEELEEMLSFNGPAMNLSSSVTVVSRSWLPIRRLKRLCVNIGIEKYPQPFTIFIPRKPEAS